MATHIQDLKNNVIEGVGLTPVARTATSNGLGVDFQNGMDQCTAFVICGTMTDGTHTITFEESKNKNVADASGAAEAWAAVPSQDTLALTSADAASVKKANFVRSKRYVRVTTTVAGATTGGVYGIIVTSPRRLF